MSLGLSVVDLVSTIKHLSDVCILYQECQRLKPMLANLLEECSYVTDLDVVFIADFNVCITEALTSELEAKRLLRSTGLVSASRDCSMLDEVIVQRPPSEEHTRSLGNDLRQRAQHLRLILVCDVEKYQILREALRNDEWLQSRIFGVTMFETHQHSGQSCQQIGTVCCSEEGPDLVLWSVIRLVEESKKDVKLERVCTASSLSASKSLNDAVLREKLGRTQASAPVLQCVAFAYRPLHIDELREALATDYTSASKKSDIGSVKSSRRQQDFTELISDFLEVRDNGLVFFKDKDLQHRVLTGKDFARERNVWRNGHEVLATVCLQHLQCLGRETVIKPWASTGRWLVNKGHECRLHSYATAFWHEHFRLAEAQSRHLPALLHRTISSAIAIDNSDSEHHTLSLMDKTNWGLWVSATYGLRTLCKTYLEMGADLYVSNIWHKHPLQMLSSRFHQQHLGLSLDFSRRLDIPEHEFLAPGHCARIKEIFSSRSDLHGLQKASNICRRVGGSTGDDCQHSGLSSLEMAMISGHSGIMELFGEYSTTALQGLENNMSPYAAKSGHLAMWRETLPFKPRGCNVQSQVHEIHHRFCEIEHAKTLHVDCFSGVNRPFHSIFLAETQPWNDSSTSTREDVTGASHDEKLLADRIQSEEGEWLFVTRGDVEMG